jgi:uncharacterized Zn-finger protein
MLKQVQHDEGGFIAPPACLRYSAAMATDPYQPETQIVESRRVICDGATQISAALGHPRVFLEIDEKGSVDCGYCDKRFILKGGPADLG